MSSATIGSYSVALAFLAAIGGILAAIAFSQLRSNALLRAGRWALGMTMAFLTVALAALAAAFLGDDFSIKYVAGYSERAMSVGYKLAAVWAGQEGSLLLWAWLLAVLAWVAGWTVRKEPDLHQAATVGILAAACVAFGALLLFGADPFELSKVIAADGQGLNPMLQDPAMIAHPPLLFAGYAAFAVPFALLLGAYIAGRSDNQWVFRVRRWTLGAWALLTVGIFLGAWWAYIELGWGGYWAWDPVENASLLPWFTATAALHTLIIQQRRGMLRASSFALVVLTFLLCLVGSYLTRSGVVQSVHAFPESPVGWFFLGMISAGLLGAILVTALRIRLLRSLPLTRVVSLEGAFLVGCALLVVMAGTTLVGTIFPLISRPFTPHPVTLGPEFYNSVIVPMGLILTALMAAGPLLAAMSSTNRPKRRLILGGIGAIHGIVASVLGWPTNAWMLVTSAIVGFAAFLILGDIIRTLLRPVFKGHDGLAGVWRTFRANSRRFAGLLTHLGMAMLVMGVAGSSLFGESKDVPLRPGESAEIGSYIVRLDSTEEVRHSNFEAIEAAVTVSTPGGRSFQLKPQRRQYDKSSQVNTEVALRTGLRGDFYLILRGVSAEGQTVFSVLLEPLVAWIWIGSIVMTVGAGLCMVYRAPWRGNTGEPQAEPQAGGKAPARA